MSAADATDTVLITTCRPNLGSGAPKWPRRRGPGLVGEAGAVAVDVLVDSGRGVAGSEVGAVAAEDLDPLLARFVDGVGDEVSDVAVAAAGHRDVRHGSSGVLADDEVGGVDGLALCTVGGGGEGELDVVADVVLGQRALAGAAGDDQAAVVADAGDRPEVAVGDAEVAVVEAGGDAVAESDAFASSGDRFTDPIATGLSSVADGGVDARDLFAGVGDDQLVAAGTDVGDGGRAFDVAGVHDDLPALEEGVEHGARTFAGAHQEADVGVRLIAEAVDGLELEVRLGRRPSGGKVEDAAAADSGELVAVAEERDGGTGVVGDREERAGGVLVEHAGFVDEEYVAGEQPRSCDGGVVNA